MFRILPVLTALLLVAVVSPGPESRAGLPDSTPPAAVDDLRPTAHGAQSVTLSWNAPGDDGQTGTAALYDLRYSDAPIDDEAAFAGATAVAGLPLPLPAGQAQTFEIDGLSRGEIYYFALKTADEAGNWSAASNEASGNTSFEGYGHATAGGSGADVYHVTSLANSGAGTLRDGIYNGRTGPRTIVFDVGGTIALTSDIRVRDSLGTDRLTVDGSTAPAPGITIRKPTCAAGLSECPVGNACLQNGEFLVGANESDPTEQVILSRLRFHGNYELPWGACLENSGATLGLQYHFRRIVLDHLTIRNGVDASPDLWTGTWTSSEITIANTLIAWSNHPLTISGAGGGGARDSITLHRNVLARSRERMPQFRGLCSNIEFRNNVIFDWAASGGSYGTRVNNDDGQSGSNKTSANIVGNYWVHTGEGDARDAFFYGSQAGSEPSSGNGDGVPAACTTSNGCSGCNPQGTLVTTSFMGELWVEGNVLPPETCEKFSTVAAERPVPADAQVTTENAMNLVNVVLPDVGTGFRFADEQALIDELATHMGGCSDGDGDGFSACEDCDDGDDLIYPGAIEWCDGADNDCNGEVDEAIIVAGPGGAVGARSCARWIGIRAAPWRRPLRTRRF